MGRIPPSSPGRRLAAAVAALACACALTAAGVMASTRHSPLPDLRSVAVSVNAASISPGGRLRITDRVRNVAAGHAGRSTVGIYLSPSLRIGHAAVSIERRSSAPLAARRSSLVTKSAAIPAATAPGRYLVVACADVLQRVNESDERDNCVAASRAVEVTAAAERPAPPAGPIATAPAPAEPPAAAPVTLDTPVDGASTNSASTLVTGHAGTGAMVHVDLHFGSAGGPLAGHYDALPAADGSWSAQAGPLGDGAYDVQASQTDNLGRSSTSAVHALHVDRTAPVVGLAQPADGSTTADGTPAFSGAAGAAAGDAGSVTINLYAGSAASGTPVASLTAPVNGTGWSAVPAAALADGTYTAQAEQQDASGNTGRSAAHVFRVDTSGPTVSIVHPLNGSVGASSTPTIDGTAGAAAGDATSVRVSLFAGATATGTPLQVRSATAGASGAWSVSASPALPDGTYTAEAEQADSAGNTGTSAPHTFQVDTVKPAVTLTQPAGDTSTSDTTPAFSGGAGTATGDLATVAVKVYGGSSATGTPVTTLTATANGASWSASPAFALADGTYTAQAEQQDTAGNTGRSGAVTFTIDTAPPAVTLSHPSGAWSATGTPLFDGSAGTAAGDPPAVTVRVYSGSTASGTPLLTVSATARAGVWSVTPSTILADGTYTAQAEQTDAAGNSGHSATRTFTVDTAAPAITLTHPAAGSFSASGSPAFDGALGTATGDATSVTVKVYAGSTASGAAVESFTFPGGTTSWSATAPTALGDGTYTAQAEQQDAAGNTGQSTTRTFQVDTTKPTLSLALNPSSPNGQNGWYTSMPAVHVTADDPNWDALACQVDGTTTAINPTGGTTHAAEGDVPLSGDGSHSVSCTATDRATNSTTQTASFKVDRGAPTVALSSPSAGAVTNDQTPAISGSASDPGSVSVKVYAGSSATGTPAQTLSATPSSGGWSVAGTTALAAGTYTVQAEQQDAAGNTGKSTAHTFQIDTTKPTLSLSLNPSSPNGQNGWYTSMPAVHVTADDPNWGSLTCQVDGTTTEINATAGTSHAAEGDVPVSADGSHSVSCTATDRATNSTTQTANFKADRTAPSVAVTGPTAATTADQTPAISGTTSDAGTVTVKVYAGTTASGTPVQTLNTSAAGGSWSATPGTLAVGTYTALASQSDAAGNTGSDRVTFTTPAVLLAAGDIASCTQTGDSATGALFATTPSDIVAALGDNAYENGTASEYSNCYDATWGSVKAKTRPAAGNHDYYTTGALGYFGYFGAAAGDSSKGYYSYELGSWHVIVLNSNDLTTGNGSCIYVSCAAGSAQEQWLKADLAAHTNQCTLAYFHHPLFTSDSLEAAGPASAVKPLWDDLYAAGADLVLNGHAHMYERFAPQRPDGTRDDANGIREIVTGTGGYLEHSATSPAAANSQVLNNDTFGLTKLTLGDGKYSWQFLPQAGKTFTDAGSTGCH